AAGEATGVGGAALAVSEGRLSAFAVAGAQGRPVAAAAVRREQSRIRRQRRFATAMHRACPVPAAWPGWLDDATLVCRCEEVTYADLRDAHTALGATDARTLKMLARPGMGWCQGRVCGFATAGIAACLGGRPATAGDLRPLAGRTPAFPLPLGELSAPAEEPGTDRTPTTDAGHGG
ncbi:(2Fe-2S)-binding protein, partial [Actinacidiphila rubida]